MIFSTIVCTLVAVLYLSATYAQDCDGERIPCGECVQKSESFGGCSWCSSNAACQGPLDVGVSCDGGEWLKGCPAHNATRRGWQSTSYCAVQCGITGKVVGTNGKVYGGKCCLDCSTIGNYKIVNGLAWSECPENGPPPTPAPPTPVPPTPEPPTPAPPVPTPDSGDDDDDGQGGGGKPTNKSHGMQPTEYFVIVIVVCALRIRG